VIKTCLRPDQITAFVLSAVMILFQGSFSFIDSANSDALPQNITLIDPVDYPIVKVTDVSEDYFSVISAKSYLIVDPQSASIIRSRNMNTPLFPASTVKLMTALVAREAFNLEDILSTDTGISVLGNKVGYYQGTQMTVKDILSSSLIFSGNDAAYVLAMNYPTGYQGFIDRMNQKAKELSLSQTTFTNPTGIDDYRQLTSAWDLSLLAREILKDPVLKEIVLLKNIDITDVKSGYQYHLYNTNELLHQFNQVKGIKTGTTLLAQQVLITLWEENDHQYLIVVMGSSDRYADTLKLVEWINNHVHWKDGTASII